MPDCVLCQFLVAIAISICVITLYATLALAIWTQRLCEYLVLGKSPNGLIEKAFLVVGPG